MFVGVKRAENVKSCENECALPRGVPLQTTAGLVDGIPHTSTGRERGRKKQKRRRGEQFKLRDFERDSRERETSSRFFHSFPTSVPLISSGSTSRSITDQSQQLTATTRLTVLLHLFKLFPTISLFNNSI